MTRKKERTNRLKINKGQLAIKIMATILSALMLLSVCGTLIYYFIYYIGNAK